MNFFIRVSVVIYMLLMISVGAVLVLLSLNVFPPDTWTELISRLSGDIRLQASAGIAGLIMVLIGLVTPYRVEKKLKRNRIVAFQNPDGEVTVSLSAIEDYIKKIAKSIPGIKDIRSNVRINKKGINISTTISVATSANIPEITERIQSEVRNKVQTMLGVEESINMKIHINKILKAPKGTEAGSSKKEEKEDPVSVPYRET